MPTHYREIYITTVGGTSLTLRLQGSYLMVESFVVRIQQFRETLARGCHWLLGPESLEHLDQSSSDEDAPCSAPFP